jgi:hypothetical protein
LPIRTQLRNSVGQLLPRNDRIDQELAHGSSGISSSIRQAWGYRQVQRQIIQRVIQSPGTQRKR